MGCREGLTFVFPKDLNSTEHATFHRRLSTRHAGVKVDYWGKAALDARLQTTEGERIAASFFEGRTREPWLSGCCEPAPRCARARTSWPLRVPLPKV